MARLLIPSGQHHSFWNAEHVRLITTLLWHELFVILTWYVIWRSFKAYFLHLTYLVTVWLFYRFSFFVEDPFHFLLGYQQIRPWGWKLWVQSWHMYSCIECVSIFVLAVAWKSVQFGLEAMLVYSTKSHLRVLPHTKERLIFPKADFSWH